MTAKLKVAIIGAGFGGLGTAVALRRAGIDDITIIEAADGVGGTWRRNVYPGAACDIQSHLYSFSFALNKSWSRTYARQPEILAYLESVADDFDLRRHLMLDTRVCSTQWNANTSQWDCQVERAGQTAALSADVVVSAVGLFGAHKLPDIAGLSAQVEVRSPYLDHRMVEFAAILPHRYKVDLMSLRPQSKYLPKRF